jgi:hypothetical protein
MIKVHPAVQALVRGTCIHAYIHIQRWVAYQNHFLFIRGGWGVETVYIRQNPKIDFITIKTLSHI